jgi:hypothetical protein
MSTRISATVPRPKGRMRMPEQEGSTYVSSARPSIASRASSASSPEKGYAAGALPARISFSGFLFPSLKGRG